MKSNQQPCFDKRAQLNIESSNKSSAHTASFTKRFELVRFTVKWKDKNFHYFKRKFNNAYSQAQKFNIQVFAFLNFNISKI